MLFNKKKKLNAAPPASEKVDVTQQGALNMGSSGMSLADTQIDAETTTLPGALASPLSPAGSVAAAPTPYFNIDFGFSKFEQESTSVTPSQATASSNQPTPSVMSSNINSGVSGVNSNPLQNPLPGTLPMELAENHQLASTASAPPKTLSTFQSLAQALESPRVNETNSTTPEIQLSSPERLLSPDEMYNPYQTMSPTQERSGSLEATGSMTSPYSHQNNLSQNNLGNTASDDYFFEPSAMSPHEDESFHELYAPGFDSPLHAQADPSAPVYQQNTMANPIESHLNQTTAHPGLNSFQPPFESPATPDAHQPVNLQNQVSQQLPSQHLSQPYGPSQGLHSKGTGPAGYIDSTPITAPTNSGIPSSYASPPVSYGGGIVDDFWTHTSPGFEDLSELHQGSLIENIHQQLYPQEDSYYNPASNFSPELLQYQNLSEMPQSERPIYTPENTLSDPSILDANLNLDDFFAQVEDSTYLAVAPSEGTVHPISSDPYSGYQDLSMHQAILPQMEELPPEHHDNFYSTPSQEIPVAQPLPDHSEILANIQAEDIEVLGVCPLEQEKSLMFVQVKEHFALMALVSQQFSTLKLFPQDPRGADGSSLITAIPEKGMGNQVVYHVKIGTWQGVLNVSGSQMTVMSEL